jgi:outer membrane cobalamin receptor
MSIVRQTLTLPYMIAAVFPFSAAIAEDSARSTALDDISVTATRVEKTLESIPAAVGIVQQEAIQFAQSQLGLDESLSKVPGIFMVFTLSSPPCMWMRSMLITQTR